MWVTVLILNTINNELLLKKLKYLSVIHLTAPQL
jgi:hypothetical protein